MCGIVGFIGTEQAAPILLEGLSRLEYRGYDSAGLAVYDQEKGLQVVKAKGRLQVLYDLTDGGALVPGVMGVGHTRWATHGAPNDVNSHPQVGQSGRIAVVHNGIIENYAKLKEFLESKGVTFASETDTEVVAQLLEYYYDGDLLDAVSKVLHRIEGAYALGIVCADEPDKLVAVRKDSPLVLGYGEGFNLLASDVTAVIKHTREVCYLDDGEVAVLTPGSVQVYNSLLRPVEKERSHVDWEISAAEKGGYEHFMFKEIMEQPKALRDTIFPRLRGDRVVLDDLTITREELERMDRLYIIACGSSYHVGVAAKYILERLLRIPVEVTLASEFRYCDPIVTDRTLALVISQSGETIDTLAAMLSAVAIIPAVFAYGLDVARGPSLMFLTLPAVFQQMPMGQLFAVFFFLSVFFAGITSLINMFEAVVESWQSHFNLNRKLAVLLCSAITLGVGLFLEAEPNVGQWMDFITIGVVPIGAVMGAVSVYYVLGWPKLRQELQLGRKKPISAAFGAVGRYVYVPLTILVLILGFALGGIG